MQLIEGDTDVHFVHLMFQMISLSITAKLMIRIPPAQIWLIFVRLSNEFNIK